MTDNDEYLKNFLGVRVVVEMEGRGSRGRVTGTLGPLRPFKPNRIRPKEEWTKGK